jgi:carbamoyl-phosphate synthase large subunit
MRKINLLLTNVGRKIYFLNFIKKIDLNIKIHISDCNPINASFAFDKNVKKHLVIKSSLNSKRYLYDIINIVKKNKINILIPLTDYDLEVLSKNRIFFSKLNCTVIVSSEEAVLNCLDKSRTEVFAKKYNFFYPKSYYSLKKKINFPVVKKKILGSGSLGYQFIENKNQLNTFFIKGKDMIQEFISGEEFNIDILNDFNGKFISYCAKKKILMRAGETDKAKIIVNKSFEIFAKKLSKSLGHIGNLDCDIIIKNKKIYILDLNPRFGGGYPFTHLSGLNYINIIFQIYLGKKFKLLKNPKVITAMKGVCLTSF